MMRINLQENECTNYTMHLCIDVIKISSTTKNRKTNSDWHTYELFINYTNIETCKKPYYF